MKLTRLTTHTPAPAVAPPPALHDELHLRRARLHVVEARRDLGDLDPILDGVPASVEEALTTSIEGMATAWH